MRVAALAIVVCGGALVTGCWDGGDEAGASDGALRGELASYILDMPDGSSETRHYLRTPDGAETPLLFDVSPDVAPGSLVKVIGTAEAGGIRVQHIEEIAPMGAEARTSALINGASYPARSFAFVLVDIGGGVNVTADTVMSRMMTATDSVRNYYLYASYGRQDITAQVFGPFQYSMSGCDTSAMAAALRPQITGTFQHYLWYMGSQNSNCSWTGLGSVGTPDRPSRDTWYNASTSCVVLVHEPGHNFGMQHSSSLACGTSAAFVDVPDGNCTTAEYGDPFDAMGSGCRHMNGWQKAYQGWFGGCNGVRVAQSGTFTLLPIEQSCDGVQVLQVKSPKARTYNRPAAGGGGATVENLAYYYVELRTGRDFDGTIGNRTALTPQVQIRVGDDMRTPTQRGLHTFLLDMAPATSSRSDAALPVGQTFTDPAGGVSITVQSVSQTSATIQVVWEGGTGSPTCLDGSTFTPPGPGTESCTTTQIPGTGGTGGATGGTGGGTGGTGGATGGTGGATGGTGGATGGTGGATGGTGGATLLGLGAACQSAGQCGSGFCADGVCCDTACSGVCQACDSAGHCAMPADDAACGPIACPQSTICRSYPETLTANRCRSAGACKTSADCTPTNTPARTPCDSSVGKLCDGAGECRQPTVSCGAVASCPVAPGQCCYDLDASQATCQTTSDPVACGGQRFAKLRCVDETDCPTGRVCCLMGNGDWTSFCSLAADCHGGTYSSGYVACNPSSATNACPAGQTCTAGSGLVPSTYGLCQ